MLTSDEQTDDAKYLLNLLRNKTDKKEVRALLTGFLASTRAILDHLLEGYNIKYGLNIGLTEFLNVKTFKREATNQNNQAAINFITNFTKELDNLDKNKLWHFMQYTRNTKIHRYNPSIKKHYHARMTENLTLQDNVVAIAYDNNGNIKNPIPNLVEQKSLEEKTENGMETAINNNVVSGVKWFFNDYPSMELMDICEQYFTLTANLVKKIINAFP